MIEDNFYHSDFEKNLGYHAILLAKIINFPGIVIYRARPQDGMEFTFVIFGNSVTPASLCLNRGNFAKYLSIISAKLTIPSRKSGMVAARAIRTKNI